MNTPGLFAIVGATLCCRALSAQTAAPAPPASSSAQPTTPPPTPAPPGAPTPSPAPAAPVAPVDPATGPALAPNVPALPDASSTPLPVAASAPPAPPATHDPTRSLVHLGSSYEGAWLELKSSVDESGWQRACPLPCDRSLVVEGFLARVSAPDMTTSNVFRIQPGVGTARIRVDGGSAKARSFGLLGLFVGIPTAVAGMTLYSYGRFAERDGMQLGGAVVLGTGAVTLLAALPLLLAGSTTVRDGRGSVIAEQPSAGFGTF